MSFWTDLQAWTQAQYDALMAANAKKNKKWTADEINRLLRDRIAKRLKAKQGRAIGAEFLRTAGRLPERLPSCGIDHGFYHEDLPDVWIYLTQDLISYQPDILLDADHKYLAQRESTIIPPDNPLIPLIYVRPHDYTGLMRLYAQSRYSANASCQHKKHTGLVRNSAGSYWMIFVRTDISSLIAHKLEFPPEASIYLAASRDTSRPRFDREAAEACALAMVTVNPAVGGVTILESEYLDQAVGQEAHCWRFQHRGAKDENIASMRWIYSGNTTFPGPHVSEEGETIIVTTLRVNFAFPTADTISASLSIEGSSVKAPYVPFEGEVPRGAWEWPIQTWYDVDGNVQTITAYQDTQSEVTRTGPCWDAYFNVACQNSICTETIYQGLFGLRFFEYDLVSIVGNVVETDAVTAVDVFEDIKGPGIASWYYVTSGPARDYHYIYQDGHRTSYQKLGNDSALILYQGLETQDTTTTTVWLDTLLVNTASAEAPFPATDKPCWLSQNVEDGYYDNLETVNTQTDMDGFVIANNTVFNLGTSLSEQIGNNVTWEAPFLEIDLTEFLGFRISYRGETTLFDQVNNPILLTYAEIAEGSEWVGAS